MAYIRDGKLYAGAEGAAGSEIVVQESYTSKKSPPKTRTITVPVTTKTYYVTDDGRKWTSEGAAKAHGKITNVVTARYAGGEKLGQDSQRYTAEKRVTQRLTEPEERLTQISIFKKEYMTDKPVSIRFSSGFYRKLEGIRQQETERLRDSDPTYFGKSPVVDETQQKAYVVKKGIVKLGGREHEVDISYEIPPQKKEEKERILQSLGYKEYEIGKTDPFQLKESKKVMSLTPIYPTFKPEVTLTEKAIKWYRSHLWSGSEKDRGTIQRGGVIERSKGLTFHSRFIGKVETGFMRTISRDQFGSIEEWKISKGDELEQFTKPKAYRDAPYQLKRLIMPKLTVEKVEGFAQRHNIYIPAKSLLVGVYGYFREGRPVEEYLLFKGAGNIVSKLVGGSKYILKTKYILPVTKVVYKSPILIPKVARTTIKGGVKIGGGAIILGMAGSEIYKQPTTVGKYQKATQIGVQFYGFGVGYATAKRTIPFRRSVKEFLYSRRLRKPLSKQFKDYDLKFGDDFFKASDIYPVSRSTFLEARESGLSKELYFTEKPPQIKRLSRKRLDIRGQPERQLNLLGEPVDESKLRWLKTDPTKGIKVSNVKVKQKPLKRGGRVIGLDLTLPYPMKRGIRMKRGEPFVYDPTRRQYLEVLKKTTLRPKGFRAFKRKNKAYMTEFDAFRGVYFSKPKGLEAKTTLYDYGFFTIQRLPKTRSKPDYGSLFKWLTKRPKEIVKEVKTPKIKRIKTFTTKVDTVYGRPEPVESLRWTPETMKIMEQQEKFTKNLITPPTYGKTTYIPKKPDVSTPLKPPKGKFRIFIDERFKVGTSFSLGIKEAPFTDVMSDVKLGVRSSPTGRFKETPFEEQSFNFGRDIKPKITQRPMQDIKTTQKQRPKLVPKLDITPRFPFIPEIPIEVKRPDDPPPPKDPPPPIKFNFNLPLMKPQKEKLKKRKRSFFNFVTLPTPSVEAGLFNKFGKYPKVITGVELRPMKV